MISVEQALARITGAFRPLAVETVGLGEALGRVLAEDVVARAMPVFEAFGGNIIHVGPSGAGATIKIVNNMTMATNMVSALEAMVLGVKAGLELDKIREQFGDERRTEIVPVADEISIEDLIKEEEMVITVSHTGYI